jgi:hypothetical protein
MIKNLEDITSTAKKFENDVILLNLDYKYKKNDRKVSIQIIKINIKKYRMKEQK